jgi:uncharacterized membrane protein
MSADESRTRPPGRDHAVVTTACCAALASLVPVALYQTRVVNRLPELPFKVFDSERITSSAAAHPLGIPDALLGLGSFAVTLGLILQARQSERAETMLGAKLALDAAAAAINATRQVAAFGKLCSWCSLTALAAGVMAYAGRATIQESWRVVRFRGKETLPTTDGEVTPQARLEQG